MRHGTHFIALIIAPCFLLLCVAADSALAQNRVFRAPVQVSRPIAPSPVYRAPLSRPAPQLSPRISAPVVQQPRVFSTPIRTPNFGSTPVPTIRAAPTFSPAQPTIAQKLHPSQVPITTNPQAPKHAVQSPTSSSVSTQSHLPSRQIITSGSSPPLRAPSTPTTQSSSLRRRRPTRRPACGRCRTGRRMARRAIPPPG
jgi:hypothetical protein